MAGKKGIAGRKDKYTTEEVKQLALDAIRNDQEKAKERTGYYGKWTKCRNMPVDMAIERIKNGDPYIVRFKSPGNPDKKIKHKDMILLATPFTIKVLNNKSFKFSFSFFLSIFIFIIFFKHRYYHKLPPKSYFL